MELKKLSSEEFGNIFSFPYHVFNQQDFNSMNAEAKGIEISFLAFKTKKYKLGIIGSVVEHSFRSPFSAPFGGFSFAKEDVDLKTIDEAVDLLIDYCSSNLLKRIEITLPPLFYETSFISKLSNTLYRKQFSIVKSDLNYSIHMNSTIEEYLETLHYNAKKNLNIALSKNMSFYQCHTEEEKVLAYKVIEQNRASRGFPLRMTYNTIRNTIDIINADFFLVYLGKEAVAAAMVFHVAQGVVQVVYWGDLPEYGMNKTMNFLSYNVVKHYYERGQKVVDIGPSTENSIPNYGLCDFKESIGCSVFPKQSWSIDL